MVLACVNHTTYAFAVPDSGTEAPQLESGLLAMQYTVGQENRRLLYEALEIIILFLRGFSRPGERNALDRLHFDSWFVCICENWRS